MTDRSTATDATGEDTRTTDPSTAVSADGAASQAADSSSSSPANDVAHLSYEQAREELVAVVSRLEAGGASLEESLSLWERGEALAARCEQWLHGAQQRLEAARPQQDHPAGH